MLADYHIHTEFSDDSEYPLEEVVKDSIALKLDEICFTDHVDYGIKKDWDAPEEMKYRRGGKGEPEWIALTNVDYDRYIAKIQSMQAVYGNVVTLRTGLEFGMQTQTIPQYEALFARYPFDFIILSVHQIENREFWTQEFQKDKTQQEYNERYYEEILALVKQYHNYSVLGHLDLICRYDRAGCYPFEKLKPLITEILRTVIADGKGIEVNTSCYRYGLPDLTPSLALLKLYRELGGRILTFGSDSHKKEHLGAHLEDARKCLREIGYTQFCTYERMKPVFHPL